MISNLKTLNKRIAALEGRVAELEAGPDRPGVRPLQTNTGWIDRLSSAIAAAEGRAAVGDPGQPKVILVIGDKEIDRGRVSGEKLVRNRKRSDSTLRADIKVEHEAISIMCDVFCGIKLDNHKLIASYWFYLVKV